MIVPSHLKNIYPFKSNYYHLPNTSSRLHFIDEGKGDPILCIHGNPTWSFYFRKLISELNSKNRVIAYDHLGCGYSSRTEQFSYTLEDHIENLVSLVKYLKLKNITLVVHDWGGAIGFGLAGQYPDLIKQVIITNSAAFFSKDIPKRIRILKTPIIGSFFIRQLNIFAQAATTMASAKGLSKEVKQGLLAPYHNYRSRLGVAKFIEDIPTTNSHPTYTTLCHLEKTIQKLKFPTLILWGMKDFCFHSEFLRRWNTIYPHAQVVRFDSAGHYLFEDEPQKCIKIIKTFLG